MISNFYKLMWIFFQSFFASPFDFPKASCDCKYYTKSIFHSGGCYISVAPPKGYKCKCTYGHFWKCHGDNYKCAPYSWATHECKGCKDKECCLGDCDGYWCERKPDFVQHDHYRILKIITENNLKFFYFSKKNNQTF